MKLRIKPFPAVMTVLSALYLVYVRASEDTVLAADAVGGDPGGKLLPTIMAIFLFAGFLYLTIKERPDGKREEKETVSLFLITLGISLVYLLLLKPVGFVLMSAVLLFLLEYLYTTIDAPRSWKQGVFGGAAAVAVTAAAYLLMRFLTKTLLRLAHSGALPELFGSTVFNGLISLLLISALTVVLALTVCRLLKKKGMDKLSNAALITFAVILFLYVIFKQFFNVNLAPGLLNY